MGLRLFLDSADVAHWERWLPSGIFHGVETNPQLLERAGASCALASLERLVACGIELGAREVHVQAWGGDAAALEASGRRLASLDGRVGVKVWSTREGVEAASRLAADGIPVIMTGLYAAHQALTAAALGAAYAAPVFARMNEAGIDGRNEILAMHRIVGATGSRTRILVASLRRLADLVAFAQEGLDALAVSPPVAEAMFGEPLTERVAGMLNAIALANGAERLP